MAIFGKNRTEQAPGHGTTVIATGTQLVGNLALSDNLHVDGRIDGDIDSEAGVVIGADGHLEGRIKARNVVVSGRVQGSVAAERLEIIAGGVVEGDVHTVDLVIEPGGRFNGSSEILESTERSGTPAENPAAQRKAREARTVGDAAAGHGEEESKTAGSVPAA